MRIVGVVLSILLSILQAEPRFQIPQRWRGVWEPRDGPSDALDEVSVGPAAIRISWRSEHRDCVALTVQPRATKSLTSVAFKCQTSAGPLYLSLTAASKAIEPLTASLDSTSPEPTVRRHEPYSARPGPLKQLQLVPQRQHLQLQDGARVHATSQGQEEREENRHDGAEKYAVVACRINGANKYRTFSRHTHRPQPSGHRRTTATLNALVTARFVLMPQNRLPATVDLC